MSVMHIIPLVVIMILSGVVAAGCWIAAVVTHSDPCESNRFPKKWAAVITSLFLVIFVWTQLSCNQPWKVEDVQYLDIKNVEGPDGTYQVAKYQDVGGLQITVNLTEKYKCLIPKGKQIKYTRLQSGPYCGVSFLNGGECKRFEIVDYYDSTALEEGK